MKNNEAALAAKGATTTALVACGVTATALTLGLSGCAASYEGSGSKDAVSAEQLAVITSDPWTFEITIDPAKTAEGDLADGIYRGTGRGMAGLITATLLVENNRITCLAIEQDGETQSVGGYEAVRDGTYAAMINAAQGADIDTISGATITTAGVKQAVREALARAEVSGSQGVSQSASQGSSTTSIPQTTTPAAPPSSTTSEREGTHE
ncbi:MAG: FMN-binding protein [Coriobacteriales bacterium]|jgi:uncharacterized protein with FMN-binding domain|nr:FMN-binding protein [Coriobacteriales bacterium]